MHHDLKGSYRLSMCCLQSHDVTSASCMPPPFPTHTKTSWNVSRSRTRQESVLRSPAASQPCRPHRALQVSRCLCLAGADFLPLQPRTAALGLFRSCFPSPPVKVLSFAGCFTAVPDVDARCEMPASGSEAASPSKAEHCRSCDNASLLHWLSSFLSWEYWECFLSFLSENQSSYLIILLCAQVAQSCPTLCDPMDCSPSDSSVHEIFQARILEWVAISFSRDLPDPGIEPVSLVSPVLTGGFFTSWATWEAQPIVYLDPNTAQGIGWKQHTSSHYHIAHAPHLWPWKELSP